MDTNADGAIGTGTNTGSTEAGFSAVNLTVVCTDNTVIGGPVTPATNGTWAIENLTTCATGQAFVRATITDNRYTITNAASSVNDTPRTTNPSIGESAPFAVDPATDITVDTLVRPDWYLDLTIPNDGASGLPAVYDGTAPFDATCPQAGNDCAAQDLTVRTQDTVTFTWSVTGSSLDDNAGSIGDVVLEQTLNLDPDGPGGNPPSVATFDRVPTRCTTAGGGGTPPPTSRFVALPSNTTLSTDQTPPAGTTHVVLTCNLGVWAQTGDAVLVQPVVKVSGQSPNGSTFATTARVYAVNDSNQPTAVPTANYQFGPIDITAAPRYDLEKRGWFYADYTYGDVGTGLGSEPGYKALAVIQISTDRRVGVEALQQPIQITEDVFATLSNGATGFGGLEYVIRSCAPNANPFPGVVVANLPTYPNSNVANTGTCSFTRNTAGDATSDYTLTFDGIDMSGLRYPTQNISGGSLAAGPYYVASFAVEVFVPLRSVDIADGTADSTGSIQLYNRVGGFDPNGVSGPTNNYGTGVEPGYCQPTSVDGSNLNTPGFPQCDLMTGGTKSNNLIGPATINVGGGRGFNKTILNYSRFDLGNYGWPDQATSNHGGDGVAQPGQVYESQVSSYNISPLAWTNSQTCDVFDNTMAVLAESTSAVPDGVPGVYAWVARSAPGVWIVEYAHIAIDYDTDGTGPDTGDDPLGAGTINPVTGRYHGTWSSQASVRCNDDTPAAGWFTDPNLVPGGIDAVNAVRVRPGVDPSTGQLTTQPFITYLNAVVPTRLRDTFHGGPHDGEVIPAGAVFANYGAVRSDQINGGAWSPRNYVPAPETSNFYDGDRVTITRAIPAIQKRTITVDGIGDGAAPVGTTGSAIAGNPIVWEVLPTLTAVSDTPAPVENLVVRDLDAEHPDSATPDLHDVRSAGPERHGARQSCRGDL
ncbi:MAG TPA: hypothetical protein DCR14_06750 [Acidimicrobiaceae bacterium]|nr:hypothetical protein [Acidimicrobiaceae bacterium]